MPVRKRNSSTPAGPKVPVKWRSIFREIPGYDPIATAGEGEWFDAKHADNVIEFVESCCTHVIGHKAGTPLILEKWQKAIFGCLFGWKRTNGTRRYRECLIYIPRKNSKTTMGAAMACVVAFLDNEHGVEIYSTAAEIDQAAICWKITTGMMKNEPEMASRVEFQARNILIEGNGIYKSLSAKAETKHGYNPHFVINDELHAHRTPDLTHAMETGMGARTQPLIVHATTADYERPESVCNVKHDYACKIRDGVISDPAFLPIIYEASRDDDWTDPEVWRKANPNLGVSVSMEFLQRECEKAKNTPSYQNEFKRLHLNIRTEQLNRWLLMDKWNDCGSVRVDPEALRGRRCHAALDLSSKLDLTAWTLLFPEKDGYFNLTHFFIPRDNAHKREHDDRVPYTSWADGGWVTMTEGNTIDQDFIVERIVQDSKLYEIVDFMIDPYYSSQISTQLRSRTYGSIDPMDFPQNIKAFTNPSKELEKLVMEGKMWHGNNPVLTWNASNATIYQDASGNIRPVKPKGFTRIDGIVTTIMALGAAMLDEDDGEQSVYATREALMF